MPALADLRCSAVLSAHDYVVSNDETTWVEMPWQQLLFADDDLAETIVACPCSYAEFGGEEVKRQWEWRRRTEAERNVWASIGTFLESMFNRLIALPSA